MSNLLRIAKIIWSTTSSWARAASVLYNLSAEGATLLIISGMRQRQWGRIVNLSSTAGKSVSTMGGAHYTAAKAGVLGLTRHIASEVAGDGITVNAICPGLIDTNMTRTTISTAQADAYAASFPIPRLGRPKEVADLIAFLATEQASYITGASLDINGGDLMI